MEEEQKYTLPAEFYTDVKSYIEALLFASDEPVSTKALNEILGEFFKNGKSDSSKLIINNEMILEIIRELNQKYKENDLAFHIVEIAGGFQYATLPRFAKCLGLLFKEKSKRRLSQSALETLAIVAFRQPISKPDIENIRGVNSDYVISTLLEKNLISMVGRADTVGRPLLYGTTKEFLKHFGLKDISDLPKLKEVEEILNSEEFKVEIKKLEESLQKNEDLQEDFKDAADDNEQNMTLEEVPKELVLDEVIGKKLGESSEIVESEPIVRDVSPENEFPRLPKITVEIDSENPIIETAITPSDVNAKMNELNEDKETKYDTKIEIDSSSKDDIDKNIDINKDLHSDLPNIITSDLITYRIISDGNEVLNPIENPVENSENLTEVFQKPDELKNDKEFILGDTTTPIEDLIQEMIETQAPRNIETNDDEEDEVLIEQSTENEQDTLSKIEQERIERERIEQERIDREKMEQERIDRERIEQERIEQERIERDRIEQERIERDRIEQERIERDRIEQERIERDRIEQERIERDRIEQERKEQERIERERKEQERIERERKEQERIERERKEQERIERERKEQERIERERIEQERIERECIEQARIERECIEQARIERERMERERKKYEQERIEQERIQQERERLELAEREKLEREKKEQSFIEQETRERERLEHEKKEYEKINSSDDTFGKETQPESGDKRLDSDNERKTLEINPMDDTEQKKKYD